MISGNSAEGVLATGVGIMIQGNYIGTDVAGAASVSNLIGVSIPGRRVTLGGTVAGAANVVSANVLDGVRISGERNTVQGNLIGADATGTVALGNGEAGIQILSARNSIGGTTASAGNVIAFNGTDGVVVDTGTENAIQRNSIFANSALGIVLLNGGNDIQEPPSLSQAVWATSSVTVAGALVSEAETPYVIEFFINDACDPSGFGEGRRYLGDTTVVTASNGVASFGLSIGAYVKVGEFVTATATDPENNTSAFSGCVVVEATRSDSQPPKPIRMAPRVALTAAAYIPRSGSEQRALSSASALERIHTIGDTSNVAIQSMDSTLTCGKREWKDFHHVQGKSEKSSHIFEIETGVHWTPLEAVA